jgi:uncharacterized protein YbaP (TraB family)
MIHLFTSRWRCARLWLLSVLAAPILLAVPARAEPAMWVIRDKDSTIYLIGTIHLLRHETEWSAAKVKKAVTESSELWLEVANIDEAANIAIIARHGFDQEKMLSSKLNAAQKEKLAKIAATYGVPIESLEPMKPWMAALMFAVLPLQQAGYDPNAGIDRLLRAQAAKEGDKIQGSKPRRSKCDFSPNCPSPIRSLFSKRVSAMQKRELPSSKN